MAFWNRKKAPQHRTLEIKTLGLNDELSRFIMFGADQRGTTAMSAIKLYEDSTVVSIPINRIAEAFASLEPVLEVDGKKIVDHKLLDLLRQPCPEFSKELFFQALATYYLVTGEAFMLMMGGINKPPLEIYPISPADIMHNEVSGLIQQFQITGNLYPSAYKNIGKNIFVSAEQLKQLVHIRNFNSTGSSILRGRSKLVSASNAVRQQLLGMTHNLSLLERGGRLSLVFHFENDLEDDEYQAVKKSVISQYGGAENAGGIGVTAGGKLDIKEAGMTNMDMDWLNAQKLSMDTLLLTYNLPLPLFSTQAATFDNYSTALTAFYDDCVIPLSRVIFGAMSVALFNKFKIAPNVKLTFDKDQVSALIRRRNDEVKMRKEIGIETDNELRGILGREPYKGGDIMYKPSSDIPIGTDILTNDDDVTGSPDVNTED